MESKQQPTSERRALIKAAGKRLERKTRKIDKTFFYCFDFYERAQDEAALKISSGLKQRRTLSGKLGSSESRGKFSEKCFFEAGRGGVREKFSPVYVPYGQNIFS